ncbi:MAG TPA: pitrilysin family protein [Rhodocyclaceae bacterium]
MNSTAPRFAGALVAAFAFAAAAPVGAAIPIDNWTAATGAKVYFVASPGLPILDLQIAFPAGSAFDPPGKEGLAGMVTGTLDLGAGNLDENAIAEKLADLGARLGGSASSDRASVSLRTLSDLPTRNAALALLKAVITQPAFPAAVVAREKARAVAGLQDALTRPDTLAARAFDQALYGNHPYGRQTSVESLNAIGRDDLIAFHRERFTAPAAVVTIVGAVTAAEARVIADDLTAGLPRTQPAMSLPPVALPAAQTIPVPHPATQAHVLIGTPAMRRGDPDYFPLYVGNYVLGGGGFVSRLTNEIRDKRGLAYSVYSYFNPQKELGPMQIGLQTKAEQADEAIALVRQTLDDFLRNGPTETELAAAKANLVGGFPLRLDSNRKILDNVAVIAGYGLPLDWLDTYRDRVAAVTIDDIRAAFARRIKPEHLITVRTTRDAGG